MLFVDCKEDSPSDDFSTLFLLQILWVNLTEMPMMSKDRVLDQDLLLVLQCYYWYVKLLSKISTKITGCYLFVEGFI